MSHSVNVMDNSDQVEPTDEELKLTGNIASAKLVSGKKDLKDLVESGTIQPDDRIITLRAENQQNKQIAEEAESMRKEKAKRETE